MVRRMFAIALAAALMAGTAYAQQAPAAPAKQEKPAPRPPPRKDCPSTSGVELTITDQAGPGDADEAHRQHDRRGQEGRAASAARDGS